MRTVDTSVVGWHAQAPGVTCSNPAIREELRNMLVTFACDFAVPGTAIYEIGCGDTVLPRLHQRLPTNVAFVAMDESAHHLGPVRMAFSAAGRDRRIEVTHADLNQGVLMRHASVVLLVSSLRSLKFHKRAPLMSDIHRGLCERGCLILVEQVLGRDSMLNNVFATHGADSAGHDDRLLPYSLAEEHALLNDAGFRAVEVFFKWYGLCALIAVK